MSDAFGDLNIPGLGEEEYESSYLAGGQIGDDDVQGMPDDAALQE
jgi:hypothetical protein